jgi:hypothetical protein
MVTADEIGSIAIFAGLSEADRERLARAAADITLAPGEYAAHEGAERALFAVLDDMIEAVKLVDGIPRVVGKTRRRRPLLPCRAGGSGAAYRRTRYVVTGAGSAGCDFASSNRK